MDLRPLTAALVTLLPACLGAPAPKEPEKIPVLVISGANNHDWQWTSPSLARILELSGRFEVDVTYEPGKVLADAKERSKYRAFVLDYNGPGWGDAAHAGFMESVKAGTGVVIVHAANNSGTDWPEYERMVGDLWRAGTGHGRFHDFDVNMVDRDHAITHSLPTILAHPDELYHNMINVHGVERRVLATSFSDPETGGSGKHEPMVMVRQFGKGRIFHTPLGHVWKGNIPSQESHRDPQFRGLIVRGTEWAATGSVQDRRTVPRPLHPGMVTAGWRSLMDPELWRSSKGGPIPASWVFDGELLRRTAAGGDIVSVEDFENFELEWQWKTTIASNSGLKYRFKPEDGVGPEYQMLDHWADAQSKKHRAGALYDVAAPAETKEPIWGEFRRARVVVRGAHIEHWLDGSKVMEIDTDSDEWRSSIEASKFRSVEGFAEGAGKLLLQDHGDEVWIRGLRIRPIPSAPVAALAPVDDSHVALFRDGDDLSSWGHVGDATYRVEGDLLIGEAGPKQRQSFLVSKETFQDFELLVDLKIVVTGNSGIQIRSHVNSDGRLYGYQAEIDQTDRSWSAGIYDEGRRGWINNLEDNKPARQAFKRGDWNEYRILCEGPHIRTWVNGVPAADLLDGADLWGKIAFQIHGGDDDIVMHWRNARVKRLGGHSWESIAAGESAPMGDGDALRATVSGASARITLVGNDELQIDPTKAKTWRDAGENEVTVIRAGERVVVQVNDLTTHDRSVPGLATVRVEGAGETPSWRVCR